MDVEKVVDGQIGEIMASFSRQKMPLMVALGVSSGLVTRIAVQAGVPDDQVIEIIQMMLTETRKQLKLKRN
jgi:hypothetical protein